MSEYNGHRSWNAWNVSLWINNDEYLNRLAYEAVKQARNLDHATSLFCRLAVCLGDKTPDGAVYNRLSIKNALAGFSE